MLVVGCTPAAEPAAAPAEPETPAPMYSPFVVVVDDPSVPFHEISFKDVGMSLPEGDTTFVYETIAESLRHELMSRELDASVEYNADATSPEHHLACEGEHIYVDLWHGASSPRWGYSLWSGCGEDDEFAWQELTHDAEDHTGAAEPLARGIARSLDTAIESGCYRKRC